MHKLLGPHIRCSTQQKIKYATVCVRQTNVLCTYIHMYICNTNMQHYLPSLTDPEACPKQIPLCEHCSSRHYHQGYGVLSILYILSALVEDGGENNGFFFTLLMFYRKP